MAKASTLSLPILSLLDTSTEWFFRQSLRIPQDLSTHFKVNAATDFIKEGSKISLCVLISAGCSHIATVEASASKKTIDVNIYHLDNDIQKKWSVTHNTNDAEFSPPQTVYSYDNVSMHGGITEDGEAVILVYKPIGGTCCTYVINRHGFTWRKAPPGMANRYLLDAPDLSHDSECLFYTRSGTPFGKNGQAEVVEVYSIRHFACIRALSFGFGDGRHLRNTKLLPQLRTHGNIHLLIDTADFDDDGERNSPALITSSDSKLNWNFAGLHSSRNSRDIFISPDDAHMFYVENDAAMLHHWDLKNPTLKPLGSIRLPGVEYSSSRQWLINGRKSKVKDAIPAQIHQARYSPKCKVNSIITVNYCEIVINVLSTFNLQIIYHEIIEFPGGLGYIPLYVGFNNSTGLNIFGVLPTSTAPINNRTTLHGVTGLLFPLKDVFYSIESIEDYADSTGDIIAKLKADVDHRNTSLQCRYSWKPGVVDTNDLMSIPIEHGTTPLTTPEDSRRQRELYEQIFRDPKSTRQLLSTPEDRHFFVPHLFSFTYPWNLKQTVSVFGVIFKNEYHLVSVGPSQSGHNAGIEIVRVLYASEIKTSRETKEFIEMYKDGPHFILHVYIMGESMSPYSGAPMPLPRWTVMAPHFLEEDAWYDTFVFNRSHSVTMPSGWMYTPNPAFAKAANCHAYFLPNTFNTQDVTNYGHRARSVYAAPKYLLWLECGLRGQRKATTNEIFLGGGRYFDTLGHYYRSIYENKTYDDSSPLSASTFALTCNIDYRGQKTKRADAFFRRLHQDHNRMMENGHAISCTLPLACGIRPMACLSFMRHITNFPHRVNSLGAVEVKNGPTKSKQSRYDSRCLMLQLLVKNIYYFLKQLWNGLYDAQPEPNKRTITLPLPGFCAYRHKLYKSPPISQPSSNTKVFWEFILALSSTTDLGSFPRLERQILAYVQRSGSGAASPFTKLIEVILNLNDRELQLSFLKVAWLEKLLAWKMRTFGLKIYLTRTALPMTVLFLVHLITGVIWTGLQRKASKLQRILTIVMVCIEALVSSYVLIVKARQAYRIPRLFIRSIFNYVDSIAIILGFCTAVLTATQSVPPYAFLAFSTLMIWIATVLMLRIYRPIGMLLLLLTDTLQGIFPFLVLFFSIILGFAFVPFFLLRRLSVDQSVQNPFSSFASSFYQLLNFVSSEYGALEPFETSTAVQALRAIYIIVITILFLNMLIAILNLKMKRADKNAANLYNLQTASLQVEIELGMLSGSERQRRDWFPEWFSYTMTETEVRQWEKYLEDNPLKWTKENSYPEDEDHVPLIDLEDDPRDKSKQDIEPNTSAASKEGPASTTIEKDWVINDRDGTKPTSLPSNNTESSSPPPDTGNAHDLRKRQELLNTLLDPAVTFQPTDVVREDTQSIASTSTVREEHSIEKVPCNICGKPGTRCTSCMLVAYCGKKHQREDWKNHKTACKGKMKAPI